MKLRQKLAVVLASAMVVTAVPVVTMAASSNRPVKEALVVKKDSSLKLEDGAGLNIELKDYAKQALVDEDFVDVFYLDLTNAKWNWNDAKDNIKAYVPGTDKTNPEFVDGITIEAVNDTTIKIKATTSASFVVPMVVKNISGEATVAINKKGAFSTVTENKWTFATTGEKKATYKVGDATKFYLDGKLAPITLTEAYKGSIGDALKFRLMLQDGDWEFASEVQGKGYDYELGYGFAGETVTVKAEIDPDNTKDRGLIEFTITGVTNPDSIGQIKLKDIAVRSTVKDPEEGDLLVDIIDKDGLVDPKEDIVMAQVIKYSNYISMKDDKAVTIEAGHTEEVEFTVGEYVDDSMIGGREIEISLDNEKAHFLYEAGYTTNDWINGSIKVEKDKEKIIEDIRVEYVDDTNPAKGIKKIIVELVDNNKAVTRDEVIDAITLKAKVCVPITEKDQQSIKIKAEGRALENACETTAVTVKNPFNVTMEPMTVKVGLQAQKGGKVVITETEKGMLNKAGDIVIALDNTEASGIKFTEKPEIEITGDLQKGDVDLYKTQEGKLVIRVKRASKTASTITLTNFQATVDRTVPQGSYDLTIGGTAVNDVHTVSGRTTTAQVSTGDYFYQEETQQGKRGEYILQANGQYVKIESADNIAAGTKTYNRVPLYTNYTNSYGTYIATHDLTVKDFFVVATPNTEEIASNGLRKGTTVFEIGKSNYTANGVVYPMSAASYIQDPGYTMIPVRYVAEAFGVAQKDILFASGTATIFAGERTIQLTNGSDIAVVNGAQIKMATKVVIKDGRTYAPVSEVARILGISGTWDNTAKTATFTNN